MPRPKKKQRSLADISALIPRAEFVIQAQNMATTITAEDRTAMQNARQRHLQGIGNHEPSLHVVIPDANNLPNAGQGGFFNHLEAAVDAALAPPEATAPLRPEELEGTNRLLEAAILLLDPNPETPSITAATNQTNQADDDEFIVDDDETATAADTTTAIIHQARPQQRRYAGRLSSNIRLARQQSIRNNIAPIDPDARRELLNLNKAKQNRRSGAVLKKE